jgi:hypothetical protein
MKKKFLPKLTQVKYSSKIPTRKSLTSARDRQLHHIPYEMKKRKKRQRERKREEKRKKRKRKKRKKENKKRKMLFRL